MIQSTVICTSIVLILSRIFLQEGPSSRTSENQRWSSTSVVEWHFLNHGSWFGVVGIIKNTYVQEDILRKLLWWIKVRSNDNRRHWNRIFVHSFFSRPIRQGSRFARNLRKKVSRFQAGRWTELFNELRLWIPSACKLLDQLRNMVSTVRVHCNIFAFFGGVRGVQWWHSFIKADLKNIVHGLHQNNEMGKAVPNWIAVVCKQVYDRRKSTSQTTQDLNSPTCFASCRC